MDPARSSISFSFFLAQTSSGSTSTNSAISHYGSLSAHDPLTDTELHIHSPAENTLTSLPLSSSLPSRCPSTSQNKDLRPYPSPPLTCSQPTRTVPLPPLCTHHLSEVIMDPAESGPCGSLKLVDDKGDLPLSLRHNLASEEGEMRSGLSPESVEYPLTLCSVTKDDDFRISQRSEWPEEEEEDGICGEQDGSDMKAGGSILPLSPPPSPEYVRYRTTYGSPVSPRSATESSESDGSSDCSSPSPQTPTILLRSRSRDFMYPTIIEGSPRRPSIDLPWDPELPRRSSPEEEDSGRWQQDGGAGAQTDFKGGCSNYSPLPSTLFGMNPGVGMSFGFHAGAGTTELPPLDDDDPPLFEQHQHQHQFMPVRARSGFESDFSYTGYIPNALSPSDSSSSSSISIPHMLPPPSSPNNRPNLFLLDIPDSAFQNSPHALLIDDGHAPAQLSSPSPEGMFGTTTTTFQHDSSGAPSPSPSQPLTRSSLIPIGPSNNTRSWHRREKHGLSSIFDTTTPVEEDEFAPLSFPSLDDDDDRRRRLCKLSVPTAPSSSLSEQLACVLKDLEREDDEDEDDDDDDEGFLDPLLISPPSPSRRALNDLLDLDVPLPNTDSTLSLSPPSPSRRRSVTLPDDEPELQSSYSNDDDDDEVHIPQKSLLLSFPTAIDLDPDPDPSHVPLPPSPPTLFENVDSNLFFEEQKLRTLHKQVLAAEHVSRCKEAKLTERIASLSSAVPPLPRGAAAPTTTTTTTTTSSGTATTSTAPSFPRISVKIMLQLATAKRAEVRKVRKKVREKERELCALLQIKSGDRGEQCVVVGGTGTGTGTGVGVGASTGAGTGTGTGTGSTLMRRTSCDDVCGNRCARMVGGISQLVAKMIFRRRESFRPLSGRQAPPRTFPKSPLKHVVTIYSEQDGVDIPREEHPYCG